MNYTFSETVDLIIDFVLLVTVRNLPKKDLVVEVSIYYLTCETDHEAGVDLSDVHLSPMVQANVFTVYTIPVT